MNQWFWCLHNKSMKSSISFVEGQEVAKERAFWPSIGSAWKSNKGNDAISIEIGRKKKGKDGTLISTFKEVKLVEGARLYLQPNTRKQAGDKQPDYYVALVTDDDDDKKETA